MMPAKLSSVRENDAVTIPIPAQVNDVRRRAIASSHQSVPRPANPSATRTTIRSTACSIAAAAAETTFAITIQACGMGAMIIIRITPDSLSYTVVSAASMPPKSIVIPSTPGTRNAW